MEEGKVGVLERVRSEEEETVKGAGERVSLAEALSKLKDPRRKQRRAHELVPLLLMVVAAMLSGSKSLYAMAQWGRERREDDPELMGSLGLLPGKSPSVATLHRVLKRLDRAEFERILSEWLASTGLPSERSVENPEVVALDGKTLRGVHGEEVAGVHLVAAYLPSRASVLTQMGCPMKGTELPTVKSVVSDLDLTDRLVMGDALQTQRDLCETVVEKGGTTSCQ